MSGRLITMLGRPGCHLCHEALVELRPLAEAAGARIEVVDIERDDALLKAHLERIPVILVDGRELCHFFVDRAAVGAALS